MTWITFEHRGKSASGKTQLWEVVPTAGRGSQAIGVISWYPGWRKYCFSPYPNTVFEQDCLRTIADYCEMKTKQHKEAKAACEVGHQP